MKEERHAPSMSGRREEERKNETARGRKMGGWEVREVSS